MKKAIFLDRDGTLNVDKDGYVYKIDDYRLHAGVIEGLRLLKDYVLFIVSNQSGIGRGYYSEEDMHKFNELMLKELFDSGIKIEKIYHCPHKPADKCECRKPGIKMIEDVKRDFQIDLEKSWFIGDSDVDMQLSQRIGCSGVCLLTGHGVNRLESIRKTNPKYIAADFMQAAKFVVSTNKKIIKKLDLASLICELREKGKKL